MIKTFPNLPPKSLTELEDRSQQLAGLSLGEIADNHGILVPADFKKEKGWTGQLLESVLGAEAGAKPQRDFPTLGVELKSLPIRNDGKPLETTYVCYAPLRNVSGITWENSNVRNKLARVLWIPVQGDRELSPRDRVVGTPFIWSPDEKEDAMLKQDWEELMDMIVLGNIESITAKHGKWLQIRPKAADGTALTDAIGKNGTKIKTRPRGFYLRKDFTWSILQKRFEL